MDGMGRECCLAWADILYFLATSVEAMRAMLDIAVEELLRHGMELKSDEVFLLRRDFATVLPERIAPFPAPCNGRMQVTEVEDLNILGMVLSRDPAQVVRTRLAKADGAATWTWRRETTGMLIRWENRVLCRMLNARMRPHETWREFQARRVITA